MRLSTASWAIRRRVSIEALPMWGTMRQFSIESRGCPTGNGSGSVTSNAAPPIEPLLRASTRASVSTRPPRAILTRKAVSFIASNSAAPIRWSGLGSQRGRKHDQVGFGQEIAQRNPPRRWHGPSPRVRRRRHPSQTLLHGGRSPGRFAPCRRSPVSSRGDRRSDWPMDPRFPTDSHGRWRHPGAAVAPLRPSGRRRCPPRSRSGHRVCGRPGCLEKHMLPDRRCRAQPTSARSPGARGPGPEARMSTMSTSMESRPLHSVTCSSSTSLGAGPPPSHIATVAVDRNGGDDVIGDERGHIDVLHRPPQGRDISGGPTLAGHVRQRF